MRIACTYSLISFATALIIGAAVAGDAGEECKLMPNPHEAADDGIATIRYYALTGSGIAPAAAPRSKQTKVADEIHWGFVLKPNSVAPVMDVRTSNSTPRSGYYLSDR